MMFEQNFWPWKEIESETGKRIAHENSRFWHFAPRKLELLVIRVSLHKLQDIKSPVLQCSCIVFFSFQLVRVTVDKCKGEPVMEGRKARAVEDRSKCSSAARLKSNKNK